ncbi:MAG: RagB/SusD family nutrient uptake outer membrane protein, partial [Bacteroidales bacterium]|nr:RagB/SusD family nutrient uptake outer membrane protein [Bacteroidales bacterium]
MKKHIILFLAAAVLCSCDSYLDVAPDNRAEVDNSEKIAALLVSAYPTNTFCYLTEISSDNADRMERFRTYDDRMQEQFFSWKDITEVDTDSPQGIWETCYKAIASANQALQAIETIGNADGSLNPQKGEALLCRAYGHF